MALNVIFYTSFLSLSQKRKLRQFEGKLGRKIEKLSVDNCTTLSL
jgi:hypothetical protein